MNARSLPPAAATFWSRLKTTPLVDLARGRLSGCLELARIIRKADLPEPLPKLVDAGARRHSWFSGRRADFAQRLASRLRQELDRGGSPDQLVVSLSDAAGWLREREPRRPLWPRLVHTPPADMLRLRLTGSLDLKAVIAAAGLAEPLPKLIHTLARRTRLWRSERIDVVRELIEHFRDGLAAGQTPEQLIESFGEVRQAARMVRAAKLRSRPLYWRLWRRGLQISAAVVALVAACYLFLVLRFLTATPTIKHNYKLELISATQNVPAVQRAWPFYRAAVAELAPVPKIVDPKSEPPRPPNEEIPGEVPTEPAAPEMIDLDIDNERPGDEHWNLVKQWLAENQPALEQFRQGGTRPSFGWIFADPENRAWLASKGYEAKLIDPGNNDQSLAATLLPQVDDIYRLGRLASVDARRALAENDRPAFLADVRALAGLAAQLHSGEPLVVLDLISFHWFRVALDLVNQATTAQPGLFDGDDLRDLAHAVASYGGSGAIGVRLDGNRMMTDDLLQRLYTDDGHGDGVLSRSGLLQYCDSLGLRRPVFASPAYGPALSALLGSRRTMSQLTAQDFDHVERQFNRPLWQWTDWHLADDFHAWLQRTLPYVGKIPDAELMLAEILIGASHLPRVYYSSEILTAQRDAALAGIALLAYQKRHGNWPQSLDELVPSLLPALPVDRFSGQPLRYRLVDGRPILYSLGPDRRDDGGQPVERVDKILNFDLRSHGNVEDAGNGDWVLWSPAGKPAALEAE